VSTLNNLRKDAKRWLRALRADDPDARTRFERVTGRAPASPSLRDVQHALALEHGHRSWHAMTAAVAAESHPAFQAPDHATSIDGYEQLARDLAAAYAVGEPAALDRLSVHYEHQITRDDVRGDVWRRVRTVREAKGAVEAFGANEARDFVARGAGFGSWDQLARALADGRRAAAAFAIDRRTQTLRIRRELTAGDWDAVIAVMRERRISALDAGGQITDTALERLASLDHVTTLSLGGSTQLTDDGLRHLARMPLEELDLNEYPGGRITDRGLEVLRHLSRLRRFSMVWQKGISDSGLSYLRFCDQLESVDVMGTATGDGVITALAGKPRLRRLKTGRHLTDAGVRALAAIPLFASAADPGDAPLSLMSPEGGPTHLMVDGPVSNAGAASLAALQGLSSLSFFWHVSSLTSDALAPLASLPHLRALGCEGALCDDTAMRHIAAMPRLRKLMAQGTVATDAGFASLSRSRTIEFIWGRECPNLAGRGFRALAGMPALRGLAVSCARVGDRDLSSLPQFPALRELLPMNVGDAGFAHVGRCTTLEGLWCMYCRDTTDAATAHLRDLTHLRTYYAGATEITDRSLEILATLTSLERVELYECRHVTDAGLSFLSRLPRLREVALSGLPGVTLSGTSVFPSQIDVDYQP